MARPLVMLDVDGPLNPDRVTTGFKRYVTSPEDWHEDIPVWLNSEHGDWVRDLADSTGADLAWASFWGDAANVWIGPPLGLSTMPYAPIPAFPQRGRRPATVAHWKAQHVVSWVAGRPFVWFDDEDFLDEAVAKQPDVPPHFVVYVSGTYGLTKQHIETARTWLDGLRV